MTMAPAKSPRVKKTSPKKTSPKKTATSQIDEDTGEIIISTPAAEFMTVRFSQVVDGEVVKDSESYKARRMKASAGLMISSGFTTTSEEMTPKSAKRFNDRIEKLVLAMFAPDDAKRVLERLADPTDFLDYDQIAEVSSALVEASSGSPTM